MDQLDMNGLTFFILATYAAQIIQIFFFSVPSAGSTVEMLFKVKQAPSHSQPHPAFTAIRSRSKMTVLIVTTLAVTVTWLIPLVAILYPPVVNLIFPFMAKPSALMKALCFLFLVSGNVLSYTAVVSLRSHVAFHAFGETTRLYTYGIYGWLRNPITVGLILIYAGFFLALPSGAMLIGFILFLLNASYRIRMEEVYLQRTFGNEYERYKRQVGKYFPRLSRSE